MKRDSGCIHQKVREGGRWICCSGNSFVKVVGGQIYPQDSSQAVDPPEIWNLYYFMFYNIYKL